MKKSYKLDIEGDNFNVCVALYNKDSIVEVLSEIRFFDNDDVMSDNGDLFLEAEYPHVFKQCKHLNMTIVNPNVIK